MPLLLRGALFAGCCLLTVGAAAFGPGKLNYDAWQSVLTKHVKPAAQMGLPIHVVDYVSIATDPDFEEFIRSLATISLDGLSHNESFAVGINAYNAFAIKTLIDHACKYDAKGTCIGPAFGLPDIKIGDTAGFDLEEHVLAGKNYSLNDVEGLMRPQPMAPLFAKPFPKEDLRIHATLVCDGTSCPNLATSAYMPDSVDAQMTAATTAWMANPWKGMRINTTNHTLWVSKIFSWFSDEVDAQGGFVNVYKPYMTKAAQGYFASHKPSEYDTQIMGYIWDANGPVPCTCMPDVTDPSTLPAACHIK